MTKLTKKEKFAMLLEIEEVAQNEMLVEFINHELELLENKNVNRKPTAQQVANESITDAIVNGMEEGKLYTITDLIKTIPECADLTNQRVSALVRNVLTVRIERIEEKKKAYFRKIV